MEEGANETATRDHRADLRVFTRPSANACRDPGHARRPGPSRYAAFTDDPETQRALEALAEEVQRLR
jgi:hypothetical protein